jgi:4,5-DOPA dioxygenase extradiol
MNKLENLPVTPRMPALFVGHGNPMNAITDNPFRAEWLALGKKLPHPRAILCVSAHWQTHGTRVSTANPQPTIHDFGGFPAELFAQEYPAPGAPGYARIARDLFPPGVVLDSLEWGLDHGAWSVLQSLFPAADVPVFQLSLNVEFDAAAHFAFATHLAALRTRGVMIIGSGNIVHNLGRLQRDGVPAEWAVSFDAYVRDALLHGDNDALVNYRQASPAAALAVPTDEHYVPLLYVAAVRATDDRMHFFTESFDLGTLSMRGVMFA